MKCNHFWISNFWLTLDQWYSGYHCSIDFLVCVARRPLCQKVNLPSCVARQLLCHKVNLPSCVARQPLCHKVNLLSCVPRQPLCHKVNLPSCVAGQPLCHKVKLPRCEARQPLLIMTCDIFGTGQTNTLTLCYLLAKTYKPAHSNGALASLKSTRSTKLLEKLLTRAAHTFHWRLWQG